MKKLSFFLLGTALMQGISFSQSGWFINRSDSLYSWYSCYFVNSNTGYVVGFKDNPNNPFYDTRPLIFKTTNAGTGWFQQDTPLSNDTVLFSSVYFTDINTGFVTIYSDFMYIGKILRTTNGGINWNVTVLNDTAIYFSVFFPSPSVGFAAGGKVDPPHGFRLIKSTNNGNTWVRVNVPNRVDYLLCVHFPDLNTGYAVGNYGSIIKTTNSGSNWTLLTTNTNENLGGVYFINAYTGVAVGGGTSPQNPGGLILRTSDGGITWSANEYSSCPFMRVKFTSPSVGYAVGWCHQIIKTTNGGLNWFNQISPSNSQYYRDVFFVNESTGYIAGQHGSEWYGLVLKTTNAGEPIGIIPVSRNIPDKFELNQNYPNPFNPITTVELQLPKASFVKLSVHDVTGREVMTLVNEELKAGSYKVDFDGSNLSSGVYFYKMLTDDFTETKKMILLK